MPRSSTILIVDDDRAIQRLLADALAEDGFTVLVEKDGEWALKSFEQRPLDAVILDLLLPAINGFEVARRLRESPDGRRVPIVFISGIYKAASHLAEAREKYGVVDFLEKPINLGRLRQVLHEALGARYPHEEAARERRAAVDAKPAEQFADEAAREEASQVEQATQQARTGSTQSVKGEFARKSFPELLAELYRWRATGALLMRHDKVKKIAYFREGRPVSIKSNLLSECLGKQMVREKMISEGECEESIRRMKASGRQQGTVLIEMGCISPHNLAYALSQQLQVKLYDVFAWTSGEYQFNPGAQVPTDPNTLDMTTAQIICEGVKRIYDEARVHAALGPVESLYVHPSKDPLYLYQELGLDDEESALFSAIDGHKTVATLVALAILPPAATLRFLYAMRCSQLIDMGGQPAEGPVETRFAREHPAPAADEPRTDEHAVPDGRIAPPPLPPPPASPRAENLHDSRGPLTVRAAASLLPELSGVMPGLVGQEREVREKLAATVAAMKKKDYFEILGVTPNASKEEVKRSYFALAKEFHPDKHFGSYSAEVKNLAAQIYDLVSTAHYTLVDDAERERYVGELASGAKRDVSDEVSRILAAEGKFQKGEELLRRKDFAAAHAAFTEAVGLYGDEGEFHAYLGWSLFQTDPGGKSNAEKAIEHIENGIRLNPKVDKSYLFLGYIQKAVGRPDRAEKQFEKAIQCNPDCIEALRELRLLGSRGRPGGW